MTSARISGHERPVFAHTVRAMLARQVREDLEVIGASLRRARFKVPASGDAQIAGTTGHTRGKRSLDNAVNFHRASPLTGKDRQSGGVRVPHFDMKPVVRIYLPTSKDGKVHARYGQSQGSASEHVNYVTDGAKIEIAAHLDYIRRDLALEDLTSSFAIDMLDAQDARRELNRLGVYSNIPGGRERQRSLFEAAERCERQAKTHHLTTSTENLDHFEFLLKLARTPAWVRPMTARLRGAHAAVEAKALAAGKPVKHINAVVADVTTEQAYERLSWFEDGRATAGRLKWKQGPSGRVQYRFVGELPFGLLPQDRRAILKGFCDELAADGWMAVGAIHQPDHTNNKRNFHIHVDGYDRPAAWLGEHDCWDFEYAVRRNGKDVHPYRQKKVRYRAPDGSNSKVDTALLMRERFIRIVNDVVHDRPDVVRYLLGTYKDNGIALTPLAHMGNRVIAAEKNGVATAIGSRAAGIIFADEAVACERRADEARAALASELALVRATIAGKADALVAVDRYEALKLRVIQRRLQADLVDVVIAMKRSRADAVIRERTPEPGRRRKRRAGDGALLAAARAHLEEVERQGPTACERVAETRLLESIEARADQAWAVVEGAILHLPDHQDRLTALVYRPRGRTAPLTPTSPGSRYEGLMRGRLVKWLKTHATDPTQLEIVGGDVRLGKAVPLSIDTLMRRFAVTDEIQRMLFDELHRRRLDLPVETKVERVTEKKAPLRQVVAKGSADVPAAKSPMRPSIPTSFAISRRIDSLPRPHSRTGSRAQRPTFLPDLLAQHMGRDPERHGADNPQSLSNIGSLHDVPRLSDVARLPQASGTPIHVQATIAVGSTAGGGDPVAKNEPSGIAAALGLEQYGPTGRGVKAQAAALPAGDRGTPASDDGGARPRVLTKGKTTSAVADFQKMAAAKSTVGRATMDRSEHTVSDAVPAPTSGATASQPALVEEPVGSARVHKATSADYHRPVTEPAPSSTLNLRVDEAERAASAELRSNHRNLEPVIDGANEASHRRAADGANVAGGTKAPSANNRAARPTDVNREEARRRAAAMQPRGLSNKGSEPGGVGVGNSAERQHDVGSDLEPRQPRSRGEASIRAAERDRALVSGSGAVSRRIGDEAGRSSTLNRTKPAPTETSIKRPGAPPKPAMTLQDRIAVITDDFRRSPAFQGLDFATRTHLNEQVEFVSVFITSGQAVLRLAGEQLYLNTHSDMILAAMNRLAETPLGRLLLGQIATQAAELMVDRQDCGWTQLHHPISDDGLGTGLMRGPGYDGGRE